MPPSSSGDQLCDEFSNLGLVVLDNVFLLQQVIALRGGKRRKLRRSRGGDRGEI